MAKDLHPDLAQYDMRFTVFQRQSVGRRADRRGPDDMPLHLDTFGRGVWGHRPVRWSAPVEAQRSDLTRVEVAQLPGGPVHLFGFEVRPLIPKLTAVAEQPLGFLVFRLWLHFEGLAVFAGKAVLGLLNVLVQCFAKLSAQLSVRQTPLTPSFWTRTLFLGLTSALTARAGLRRAAVRLVAVSNGCFNEGIKKFTLAVLIIPFLFSVAKPPFSLYNTPEVRVPSFFVFILICTFTLLFCLDLVQKFGKIRVI